MAAVLVLAGVRGAGRLRFTRLTGLARLTGFARLALAGLARL
ncbi:MAG: hypothetical protein JWP49_487, partial [Phenylobacterium sp.]|nr:hypothetical protein [Phenylobacterium sp.]